MFRSITGGSEKVSSYTKANVLLHEGWILMFWCCLIFSVSHLCVVPSFKFHPSKFYHNTVARLPCFPFCCYLRFQDCSAPVLYAALRWMYFCVNMCAYNFRLLGLLFHMSLSIILYSMLVSIFYSHFFYGHLKTYYVSHMQWYLLGTLWPLLVAQE